MRSGASLQQSYSTYVMPASTRAMIGWQDSDGDGIFDVLDVPLAFSGSGFYDTARGEYRFSGSASAVPLMNRNSWGPQNDITLNQISQIQYRIDGGNWTTAATVGQQSADVEFTLPLEPYTTLELRAIDDATGITSAILRSEGTAPAISSEFVGGFAFLDTAGEGENSFGDPLFQNLTATVTRVDNVPILSGEILPQDFAAGPLPSKIGGVTFTTQGITLDGRVAVDSTQQLFQNYNLQSASWSSVWEADRSLKAIFDQTIGEVSVEVSGASAAGSFARIEAYDANGDRLTRATSTLLTVGEKTELRVSDPAGRIASVRMFGHQGTKISIHQFHYGIDTTVTTGPDGVFNFTGLPDGQYRVALTADRVIYAYTGAQLNLNVQNGQATVLSAAMERVASPWMNPTNQHDVDGNAQVEPLDALRVINEIARRGSRNFGPAETVTRFYDTNNDGAISPLDALRVINEVARRRRSGSGESELPPTPAAASDQLFAAWPGDTQRRAGGTEYDEFCLLPRNLEHFKYSNWARFPQNGLSSSLDEDFMGFFVDNVERPGKLGWLFKFWLRAGAAFPRNVAGALDGSKR